MLFTACSPSGSETGTGGTGGAAGSTGAAGASGERGGAGGGAGTVGSAGRGGDAGTAGSAGGATAGTGGSAAGAGGATAGIGGATAGAGGTAGANGGRGGATAGDGGRGGNAGNGGSAGGAGAGGRGGSAGGAGAGGRGGSAGGAGAGERGGNGGTGGGAGRGGAGGTSVTDGGVDAGGDGSVAFNPCPAAGTACIIMPLGDSITDGVGSSGSGGGYRVPLFQQAVNAAKLLTFVGRNVNGPTTVAGRTFPRNHEGYSGYTIDPGGGRSGISPLVDGAINMFHPHIVLLMIGTNDVSISLDLANAPTRLGALIDRITTDAPNALLVIARIVPTKTAGTNTRVQTYNNAIPGLVQTRVAAGKHIVVVDMYGAFTANTNYQTALMNDDLHPNDAGYMVMAQTWYAAIGSYLPGN